MGVMPEALKKEISTNTQVGTHGRLWELWISKYIKILCQNICKNPCQLFITVLQQAQHVFLSTKSTSTAISQLTQNILKLKKEFL